MSKRVLAFALACAVCLVASPRADALSLSARRAALLDGLTGELLYGINENDRALIASTTKIMTGLLAAERMDLDKQVRIPASCVGIEGSSLYLREGETMTARDLLYGVLLQSGNDAAAALAYFVSRETGRDFVELMNQRAAQMGLCNTRFTNPHGLNADDVDSQYASAHDLAVITWHAMQNETFAAVVSTKTKTVAGRALANHNKMLWNYEDTCGVKTGYTKKAGRCLVSAARRNGRLLIAVTLDAPSDWSDHRQLLDWGFARYEEKTLCMARDVVTELPVLGGLQARVRLCVQDTLTAHLTQEEEKQMQVRLTAPRFVWARVTRGQQAGIAAYYLGDTLLGSTPVYYVSNVEPVAPIPTIWDKVSGSILSLLGRKEWAVS